MRFASRELIRAAYGQVETTVCGAGFGRIFFEVELPELIANRRIEAINGIPMHTLREIYFAQGAYVTFREICKAELDMARQRAHRDNSPEAWEDFRARLGFFRHECKETGRTFRDKRQKPSKKLKALCANLWNNDPARPFECRSMAAPFPSIN